MKVHGYLLSVALFVAASALAEDNCSLGFGAKVEAEGIFSPTVKSIRVSKVAPGSPAAVSGLAVGDSLEEIEGVQVSDAKASKLKELMKCKIGESLHFTIKRSNGERKAVVLVAVQKPAEVLLAPRFNAE